jgi:hypothetical protein
MSRSAAARLRANAAALTSGLPRCAARGAQRAVRFSPAGRRPVYYRQLRRSPPCTLNAVVYLPVRGVASALSGAWAALSWCSSINERIRASVSSW